MSTPVDPGAANQPVSNVGDDFGLGITLPGTATVDESGRRRTHPITPLIHGVTAIPIGVIVVIGFGAGAVEQFGIGGIALALIGAIVICLMVAGFSYLGWRNRWYWFDDDGDFRIDSGVITKQERRLQLSRLQAVDVAQPLFARLFSMAELTIEVAGSGDSRQKLQFLTLTEARALRAEILARAAGLRQDTVEAPEVVIATVPPKDLAVSLLLSSTTALLLLLTALILAVTFLTEGAVGLVIALFTGGIPLFVVLAEFLKYFNFTVSDSPDGLRLKFGLAKTESRTVPPGRVQAIEIVEPFLWRRWGWVRLRVNIAGVGAEDSSGNKEETVLIPVADPDVAHMLIARVLPGVEVSSLPWHSAPPRSRRRSPIQWANLAVAWTDRVFAARSGRITRHIAVIPHARSQSVRYTQGPWERPLGLASVHVDSTPGPVKISARHLDAVLAAQVTQEQAQRAGVGRADDRTIRWASEQKDRPRDESTDETGS